MRLPKHLAELNNLPEGVEISTPKKKAEDKKYLFAEAWDKYGLKELPYLEEYRFASPAREYRFDFAWTGLVGGIAVEIDGGNWMVRNGKAVGRHNKDADLTKLNLASTLKWRVFRFSPTMLSKDPIGCVEIVKKALLEDAD